MKILAGLACIAMSVGALAQQAYPTQPVKLLVATSPGAGMDITTRLLARKLAQLWHQSVVVENRPGGSGAVAVNAFKNAHGSPYTLLVADIGVASISPSLVKNPVYDPRTDFKPITEMFQTSFVFLTRPGKLDTLKNLIDAAKQHPGKLNYGSGGVASGQRLSVELFKSEAHVNLTYIPYRGNNEAIMALLGGDVDLVSLGLPLVRSYIEQGKLKAIASTARSRSPLMPDTPTLSEFPGLHNYEANAWVGLFAPPGMPDDAIKRIQSDVASIMKMPDIQKYYRSNDYEPGGMESSAFAAKIEADRIKYQKVIQAAHIPVQ